MLFNYSLKTTIGRTSMNDDEYGRSDRHQLSFNTLIIETNTPTYNRHSNIFVCFGLWQSATLSNLISLCQRNKRLKDIFIGEFVFIGEFCYCVSLHYIQNI